MIQRVYLYHSGYKQESVFDKVVEALKDAVDPDKALVSLL